MAKSQLDPHLEDIRAMIAHGLPQQDVAVRYGVSRSTAQQFLAKHGITAPEKPAVSRAVRAESAAVSREERLEAEVKELRKLMGQRRKRTVAEDRVLDAIESAMEDVYPLPYTDVVPPETEPDGQPAHHRQACIWSDWHGGEVVRRAEVGGLNEFNWQILEERVDQMLSAMLSFKRVRPALTGLDLWVLGDMVSGDIHEELTATNQYPIAKQSVLCGYLLGQAVARLAPHYPEIHIAAVAGNHARTKKPHASKSVFDSWDWTAYSLAAAYTRELENVTWDIPEAGTVVRKIAGKNILLFHGDGIKTSMPGVPWGGVMRRTNELAKQYSDMGVHIDGYALGHFHQANAVQGRIFMNGSLIGTNEFGYKNFGGGEVPKQMLMTWDEKNSRLTDVAYITPTAGVRN